jgi:TrmH family RNA methyltransferase
MSFEKKERAQFGDFIAAPEKRRKLAIVLVEAQDPRNIGAVARAMSNMGELDLRLVRPARFNIEVARGVACWGSSVVDAAPTYTDLREAVADAQEVVGFASDSSNHRLPQLLLHEWIKEIAATPNKSVALVFGSEENGLRREHFPLCQYLIRIPSSGANRSYNLAQAVLLTLYELHRDSTGLVGGETSEFPTSSQLDQLTTMVLRVATQAGFLNENSPEGITDLLVNVTRRGKLSARELKILTGLFGHISKRL